jgi:hypothetical protein
MIFFKLKKKDYHPMVEVSCFFISSNIDWVNFTFIKYEKFIKIIFQGKMMVLAIENLYNYNKLYQFYILSLLCTKDVSKIELVNYDLWRKTNDYAVSTLKYWKYASYNDDYVNITLEKKCTKNPLLSQEPKRETSNKKQKKIIRKFTRYFNHFTFRHPSYYINKFLLTSIERTNIKEIIEYEKKIEILSCIRGANRDAYSNILKFM